MKRRHLIFIVIIAISILLIIFLARYSYLADKNYKNSLMYISALEQLTSIGRLGSAHVHSDIKVYVNGEEIRVYQQKNFEKNKFTHMHPGKDEEDVIHVHATGITLKQFFNTLNIKLSRNCIIFEDGNEFCNDRSETLKYYVNGKINDETPDNEVKDLDKILITYGDESQTEIQKQLASIGNNACIQSKKC